MQGELRILCTTIAYALGVNPPEVKFVVQRGRCTPEDAMQKLGRANRSGTLDGGSVFIWLPEVKVRGPSGAILMLQNRIDFAIGRGNLGPVSQASSTQYVFPSWCRTHLLLQQFGRRRPSLSYGRTLHLNCGGRRSFLMTSTSYIIQVIGVCGESC